MTQTPFYIVDVFAEKKYTGNQLAVVRNAASLSTVEMQQIAREMNYSETTFILSDEENNGGYDVRIFTPAAEVPFAGHPTLGTAFIIQREIIKDQIEEVKLNLKVGKIPVRFSGKNDDKLLRMKQIEPIFYETLDIAELMPCLNLQKSDFDRDYPIQEVSTGIPFIIVPLTTIAALNQAHIIKEEFFKFIRNKTAKAILLYCPDTYNQENDLCVRVFADYYGVPEDPATGSANGCLAGYLVQNNYYDTDSIDIKVEQGYEIGRPSLLHLKAEKKDDRIDVYVGGRVQMVASGVLI
ncbi:PhzF family phenazine biosynthesis isomerase [candidate division KSB1 bacterium]|nr:PhzF family phenazine biosynthesis isomerase [candidate division KSB1 bacterium]